MFILLFSTNKKNFVKIFDVKTNNFIVIVFYNFIKKGILNFYVMQRKLYATTDENVKIT